MKHPHSIFLLVAITLGGFTLRLVALDVQPLWWDEGYSLFFATRDFVTMLERTAVDIHPPLYYALLQVWLAMMGKTATAARLFSVFVGTATIPLVFALARALVPTRVALTTALVFALAPLPIYYSQEVRMYGLVTLLALAAWYCFVRLLDAPLGKPQTVVRVLLYIGTTTAALYTQYYAVFIVVTHVAVVLWYLCDRRPTSAGLVQSAATTTTSRRDNHALPPIGGWRSPQRARPEPAAGQAWSVRCGALIRRPLVHWIAAWSTIALLYLPWMIYAGPKLYAYVTAKVAIEKYAPLDPLTFLAQHLAAFSLGHLTAWTMLAWASVVVIALAVVGIKQSANRKNIALLAYLAIPLALGYIVNVIYPFHPIRSERLLLFAAPAFYLLVAQGIHALWNRRALYGALTTVLVAMLLAFALADFYNLPRYPQDDYRPLLAEVKTLAQDDDVFLAIYPWQIGYLEAYYTGAPLRIIETPNDAWMKNPAQMHRALDTLREQRARVWLPALQTQGRILEDALDAYLRAHAYSILDHWHGTTRLEFFAFADDPPLLRAPRNLVFDGASLNDVGVSPEPIRAGQDIVRVRFFGNARAPTTVSFRLLDANGTVWAQSDREIGRDLQRLGIALPLGTPPGEYDLRVTAYRSGDPKPLRVAEAESTSVSLATVHIIAPTQPNLAALPHRTPIDFENGIRLMGYEVPTRVQPGVATPLTLFWQATRALEREYILHLHVQDARGNRVATTQAAPTRGLYTTTRWQIGKVVRDPQTILVRGNTPDGTYRLFAAWQDPTTGTTTRAREIATLTVRGRTRYFGAPTPTHRLDAQLGEVARLVGYDVSRDAQTLRVVLYWRARGTTDTSYTVFVHVVDASGAIRAQGDQIPGAGAYPTTTWLQGEYLVDVYDIALPHDISRDYSLRVGMYDATGARLPVFDARGQPLGDYIEFK